MTKARNVGLNAGDLTSPAQSQLDAKAPTANPTFTDLMNISEIAEPIQVIASAPTSNIDLVNGGAVIFTTNASANFAINLRWDASTTLNSKVSIGKATTVVIIATQGATPYYLTGLSVDGTAQTIKWVGGTAPTSGDASSLNIYSFSIIKTAANTYTIIGAKSKAA